MVEAPLHENPLDFMLDVVVDGEVNVISGAGVRVDLAHQAKLLAVRVLPPSQLPGRSPQLLLELLFESGHAHGHFQGVCRESDEPHDLREVLPLRIHAHELLGDAELVDAGQAGMHGLVLACRQQHVPPAAPRVLRVGVHHLERRQVQRFRETGDVRPPDFRLDLPSGMVGVLVAGLGVNRVFPHDLRAGVRHAGRRVHAPAQGDGVLGVLVGRRLLDRDDTEMQQGQARSQPRKADAEGCNREPKTDLFATPCHSRGFR